MYMNHSTMLRSAALLRRGNIARRASSVGQAVGGGIAAATANTTTTKATTTTTTTTIAPSSPSLPLRRSMGGGVGGSNGRLSGSSFGESIPEEYKVPVEETEGEWEGCYLKFLAPISVGSRGVGEMHIISSRADKSPPPPPPPRSSSSSSFSPSSLMPLALSPPHLLVSFFRK